MEKTTITLTTEYATITVEVNKTDMTIHEVVEELVRPVLLGSGYHHVLVDEVLGEQT